ncbi:kinesin-like protein KIN-14G [Tanacetum coccineum]
MAESEDMTSMGEDVDIDPTNRNEAASWVRKRAGVVAAKDLPAEPSQEAFRLGLQSGMILCNILNKIKPLAVPNVVNAPSAVTTTPDEEAQSAYYENISNFLTAIEEIGLPTFDLYDLDEGGDFSRVVNTILALRAYSETGARKFLWNSKASSIGRSFVRRNSESALNTISRTHSLSSDRLLDITSQSGDGNVRNEESDSGHLYMIVCDLLEDREEEDIPMIVENIVNKVNEEFESRLGEKTKKVSGNTLSTTAVEQATENIKKEDDEATKQQEDIKREEADRAAMEQERIKREKELLELQEKARKKEEDEKAAKEQERIEREKELLALQEEARKQDAAAKEQERINKEKELLALQEEARKQEEAAKEQERLRREKEEKETAERIKREQEEKEKAERIKREKEKARKLERERIKQEKKLKAQEEKMRKKEEARARKEQERIQRQKELQALREKAKQEELSAKEVERLNIEKELLEEEERLRQQEEEQEHIEREIEQQRAMRKEEYKRRMEEYNKYNVNTEKRQELTAQQDKELQISSDDIQELRRTISAAKTDVRSMQQNCQEEADNLGTHAHTICHAAAGYNKVLEENRKLYNQVQDLKGNIRVYCRIRPFLPGQEKNVTSVDYTDDETVAIIIPTKSGREGRKASMFNKVFGSSATQEEVFSDTQPLIRTVLDGFNVCIFACGQTGSGKTYTLTGPDDLKPDTMGVSYRALNDLFNISEERKNLMNYEISINMVEIYNDEIRDLLIVNGSKKGINLPDANRVPVSSTDEVINLMNLCRKNRAMNDHSSRSHSFLTVHVFGKDVTLGTTIRGCMHLVDLAGNEKLDNLDDEATQIQKSISALGDVLVALANKSSRVPYKTCKLTQLLQEALGNQPKILMFVHVHPDIEEAGETLGTFKFVERFSTVEGGAGKSSDVRELKEQICFLKAALAKKEAGDPNWKDLLNSPTSGDSEDKSDESAPSKLKSSNTKQPAKSSNSLMKKMAAGAAAATKLTRTKK